MTKGDRLDLPQKLEEKRKAMDRIDRRLLALLNERLHVALEAGKIKKRIGRHVYDPKREKEVLHRLSAKNRGPLLEKDLQKIFKTIIKVCRDSQMK